ncbi:flagellar protein export ATPase FliI [Minwuia thermotolerans]|uniref:Flagellum-specific ATP synthase n=1 Tax=Minwuia thermotolerans TaxID=2056226 RepID=A0A2M9FZ61_9PROT|nr:flagellar protein export ATPase FliI [Minwuia thermotolerans]PJK28748.1 flagellum-specific ATP synthase FliI [Minwuia thermotolerans]
MRTLLAELDRISSRSHYGRVSAVQGLMVEIAGIAWRLSVGARVELAARDGRQVEAEIVGFRGDQALALPFGALDGVGIGCKAAVKSDQPEIRPDVSWLGRVVNALGEPIDGGPPLVAGPRTCLLRARPPSAHLRDRVGEPLDTGVRAVNTFLTTCRGQRMGIFAGSGVGKSVLLSMFAKYTESDVAVIGLIGERGREVKEFVEDYLGPEGLARSIVVVSTSDEPPLMRRQAAHLTLTLAEFFRDEGREVMCMMDSVTRFAMAQREIGLSAGEPPASKGYTPSVFAELPQLLERAGPGANGCAITGLFTVLVEGGDHDEPVADAVRGILDGHIVLDRSIAERGRYPAIDILKSISRTMPACQTPEQRQVVRRGRELLATFEEMGEMIRIGAYRKGADPRIDEAIAYNPQLEAFLTQDMNEKAPLDEGFAELAGIVRAERAAA